MNWVQISIIAAIISMHFMWILPLEQELQHEKQINTYVVDQLNKMSTKAKKLQDRVEELERKDCD